MERLPIETWTRIFSFACVDGGRTGCALSETCKYFRAAVLPVQVYSVALLGGTKMSLFLHEVLEARPPEHRRVQHLFLSQAVNGKATPDVLQAILQHVGPTLRTLTTLLAQNGISRASVLCNPLPKLEELTTHGLFMEPAVVLDGAEIQASFPSLKHLHVLSSCNSALLYIPRAPNLTHLRLSGVWAMSDEMNYCLTRVADPAEPRPADLAGKYIPSLSLDSLILVPHIGMARFTQAQHQVRQSTFHRMKQKDKGNKITLIESVYKDRSLDAYHGGSDRKHWEERIGGVGGCWSVVDSAGPYVRTARPTRFALEICGCSLLAANVYFSFNIFVLQDVSSERMPLIALNYVKTRLCSCVTQSLPTLLQMSECSIP